MKKPDINRMRLLVAGMLPEHIDCTHAKNGRGFLWVDSERRIIHAVQEREWLEVVQLVAAQWKRDYLHKSVGNLHRNYLCMLMQLCNPGVKLWDDGRFIGAWYHALNTADASIETRLEALCCVKFPTEFQR